MYRKISFHKLQKKIFGTPFCNGWSSQVIIKPTLGRYKTAELN